MTTPPGWYDDGHGAQRWWDGQGWTEHVAPPAPGAGAPTASALAADPVGSYPAAGSLGAAVAGQTGSPQASGPFGTAAAQAMPSGAAEGAPKRPFPLWIVFVVLGLLLAGLVAAAAIFLPRLFSTLEAGESTRPLRSPRWNGTTRRGRTPTATPTSRQRPRRTARRWA